MFFLRCRTRETRSVEATPMISILDILKDLLALILEGLHLLLLIVVITIILHILVQDPRLQDIIQVTFKSERNHKRWTIDSWFSKIFHHEGVSSGQTDSVSPRYNDENYGGSYSSSYQRYPQQQQQYRNNSNYYSPGPCDWCCNPGLLSIILTCDSLDITSKQN